MEYSDNVHIPYELPTRPYHTVITDLVAKYSPEKGRILDVGCGVGNMLKLIRAKSDDYELVGTDIDQHCLDLTNEAVRLEKSIKIDDVMDLFDPATDAGNDYDIIVMSHVLEHVTRPYDTVQGLMEMLKPGGHLILAVPNPVRPDNFLYNTLRMYNKVNGGHVQTWDRPHWKNFLERILKLNVVEYPTDFLRVPKFDEIKALHPFLQLMASAFPGLARSCMAVVRKDG